MSRQNKKRNYESGNLQKIEEESVENTVQETFGKIKLGSRMTKVQLGGWKIDKMASFKIADDPIPEVEQVGPELRVYQRNRGRRSKPQILNQHSSGSGSGGEGMKSSPKVDDILNPKYLLSADDPLPSSEEEYSFSESENMAIMDGDDSLSEESNISKSIQQSQNLRTTSKPLESIAEEKESISSFNSTTPIQQETEPQSDALVKSLIASELESDSEVDIGIASEF